MKNNAFPSLALCPGHAALLFSAPKGWTWRTRIGDHFNLWLALDGKGTLHTAGSRHALSAGSVVVLAPGQEVEIEHDRRRPMRNFSAHFTMAAPWTESLPLVVTHASLLRDVHPLAMQALHASASGDDLGWAQATHLVSAMLCLIVGRAGETRGQGAHAARLRILIEDMRIHPERAWPLPVIATELGLSRAQTARIFRASTGVAPGRFVIQCRMDRAVQMLADTDLPIGTIATLLGYSDVFYFSRHFKSVIGSPPSRYRGLKQL